ncbi:MAG: sugar phosphate isomerase/epimerase family protein [Armatimonadota bacterium]
MRRPEIFISALHFEWETVEEAFDRCLNDFDAHGIEFSYPHPRFGPQQLEQARELSEDTGVQTNGHFWGNLAAAETDEAAAMLRQWLEIARRAGFRQIIAHGGARRQHEAGIKIVTRGIQQAIDEFEEHGVILALENHYPFTYERRWELFSTPEEFTHLRDAVENPALGFCLDYGHSQMNNSTPDLLGAMGQRLVNTHIADNMGVHDDHLPFGEGVIPWETMLRGTEDIGFRGPFTFEFPLDESPECTGACRRMVQDIFG